MIKVVITCYNNIKFLKKCLISIQKQKFINFEVFIVDDNSDYETRGYLKEFCNKNSKFNYFTNTKKMGALYSRLHAINNLNCKLKDIICFIDGDDWLEDDNVFEYIFNLYKENDILLTFGGITPIFNSKNYAQNLRTNPDKLLKEIKKFKENKYDIVKNNYFRKIPYIFTQFQTFKYELFLEIDNNNFFDDNGEYYTMCTDFAIMYPLLEKCKGKFEIIEKKVYVYNVHSTNIEFIKNDKYNKIENRIRNFNIKKKTTWIVPICGKGTRTKKMGEFKPFININNKKIIEWFLISLKNNITFNDTFIFITTNYYEKKYKVKKFLNNIFKYNLFCEFKLILTEEIPEGPAKSVYLAKSHIIDKNNIIVINPDQFINFEIPKKFVNFITIYFDNLPSKSYCEINDNKIINIVEKKQISNNASSGVYGFKNGNDLINSLEILFKSKENMVNNEYYISGCINILLKNKELFYPIKTISKFDLGTLKNINMFKNIFDLNNNNHIKKFNLNNKIKNKKLFNNENNNIFIAMSGGTTAVINSTLAGILKYIYETKKFDNIFFGSNNSGIMGLIDNNLEILSDLSIYDIKNLKNLPGSGFIGTTRIHKINENDILKIKNTINTKNINCIINIGGSGTYKQSCVLSKELKEINLIFLPKTVDNDIGDCSYKKLYYTPGFPSCVKYWYNKMNIYNEENKGAMSHDKVLISQTFGRETGFIAGSVRLFDKERRLPLIILLPEDNQTIENIILRIKMEIKEKNRCIIIMSEGYKIGDNKLGNVYDKSGQIMYGSSQTSAAQLLVNECIKNNIQARCNIPSFNQRVFNLLTCKEDINIAFKIGYESLFQINNTNNNFKHIYCTIDRNKEIDFINIDYSLNYSRSMLKEWIDYGNYDVTDNYVKYLESLNINL
jgi:6-phosphofructokinase/glycosyltransferase involved in cell wall biosynthesis